MLLIKKLIKSSKKEEKREQNPYPPSSLYKEGIENSLDDLFQIYEKVITEKSIEKNTVSTSSGGDKNVDDSRYNASGMAKELPIYLIRYILSLTKPKHIVFHANVFKEIIEFSLLNKEWSRSVVPHLDFGVVNITSIAQTKGVFEVLKTKGLPTINSPLRIPSIKLIYNCFSDQIILYSLRVILSSYQEGLTTPIKTLNLYFTGTDNSYAMRGKLKSIIQCFQVKEVIYSFNNTLKIVKFEDLTDLESISVTNNFLNPDRARLFQSMTNLKSLSLTYWNIDLEASYLIEALAHLPQLISLDLSYSQGIEMAKQLFEGISTHNTLINEIKLEGCVFTNEVSPALASCINNLPQLKRLNLNNSNLNKNFFENIFHPFPCLESLFLITETIHNSKSNLITSISNTIRTLKYGSTTFLLDSDQEFSDEIVKCKSLERLVYYPPINLTAQSFDFLNKMPMLRDVHLIFTGNLGKVDESITRSLFSLKHVRKFTLDSYQEWSLITHVLDLIKNPQISQISHLSLIGCDLRLTGIKEILSNLSTNDKLESLCLRSNESVSWRYIHLEPFQIGSTLRSLDLSGNHFDNFDYTIILASLQLEFGVLAIRKLKSRTHH